MGNNVDGRGIVGGRDIVSGWGIANTGIAPQVVSLVLFCDSD